MQVYVRLCHQSPKPNVPILRGITKTTGIPHAQRFPLVMPLFWTGEHSDSLLIARVMYLRYPVLSGSLPLLACDSIRSVHLLALTMR